MAKGHYPAEFELYVLAALVHLGDEAYGMTVRQAIEIDDAAAGDHKIERLLGGERNSGQQQHARGGKGSAENGHGDALDETRRPAGTTIVCWPNGLDMLGA